MSKFVFKLQSILNLKKQVEDSLKNELGKAVQQLEYEKGILNEFEVERTTLIDDIKLRTTKGIAVIELRGYNSYILLLKSKIEKQIENVNYAKENVDKYREQLIKAVQEREMLEKLKEKKYELFLKEQLKEEQKVIDEVISFNYNKQKAGEENGKGKTGSK